jgi:hypothetical protein
MLVLFLLLPALTGCASGCGDLVELQSTGPIDDAECAAIAMRGTDECFARCDELGSAGPDGWTSCSLIPDDADGCTLSCGRMGHVSCE